MCEEVQSSFIKLFGAKSQYLVPSDTKKKHLFNFFTKDHNVKI